MYASPIRVDLVVYPGFKSLEAIGTMSVFEYANIHLANSGRAPGYTIRIASTRAAAIASDLPMTLEATHVLDADDLPDVAVIVGARAIEEALASNPSLVDWARLAAPKLHRLVGLCSGSFFLAQAGVLDGLRATTHWSAADRLKHQFKNVEVEADAIYIRAGHLWTSAGVTACIDLALALVEEDFGRSLALAVARDLVVYLRRTGGQSQYSMHLASQNTTHTGIRETQDWILSNIAMPMKLGELANRAAMSERNFRRVFLKEVGIGPNQYIDAARFDKACLLLQEGHLPLKSVAGRVGYTSEQSLRKLFLRQSGMTAEDYRLRFCGAPAR
ncbi:helix-turn-helix domain-containing protein [Hydrogenophaga sp. BPS33]|nr:helix-turn-helix domain-containing protein [Hydrogenophaga sp. BPS33]